MNSVESLNGKIKTATKWSSITEIIAKLINPITSIILARILSPNEFGVIATITMIISFADMLSDAGFQKYIIQHEFKDSIEEKKSINVAFISNLVIAFIIWGCIIIFSDNIAYMVGNPGLGLVIAIACIQIPITAFSSIQIALCRRYFHYKKLFYVRVITIVIPFLVTIPLAYMKFSYWSLIIGTITGAIASAVMLTLKSTWKPSLYYNFFILKNMISFSIWTLIESISIWLTSWIDVFIIGSMLSSYHLGLYKTSINLVNSIMSIVSITIIPIIFSALSRLQKNNEEFNKLLFDSQKITSILLFPMGVGIFVFKDLVTKVMLGEKWIEASYIIGIWGITSAIKMVLGDFCSEVFRAKGKPKVSLLAQVMHIVFLLPVCIVSVKVSFDTLVYSRGIIRFQLIIVQWIMMILVMKIPIFKVINKVSKYFIISFFMGILGVILNSVSNSIIWGFLSIIICIIFYIGTLYLIDKFSKDLINKYVLDRIKLRE